MHRILFWTTSQRPHPWMGAASTFPSHAVKAVVSHLKKGRVYRDTGEMSSCPICDLELGMLEMTDGQLVWPQLAQHLVMAHKVWSPQHVWLAESLMLGTDVPPPRLPKETLMSEESSVQDDEWGEFSLIDDVSQASDAALRPQVIDADDVDVFAAAADAVLGKLPEDDPTEDTEDDDESNPWDISDLPLEQAVAESIDEAPVSPRRSRRVRAPSPRRHRRTRLPGPSVPATTTVHDDTALVRVPPVKSAPVQSPDMMAREISRVYPMVDAQLATKIVSVAASVGAHPFDLANIIYFESNRSFNPAVRNPRTGAVGLIQFEPNITGREIGITVDQLAVLPALQQMDWVQVKLDRARNGQRLHSAHKLAMAVFFPPAIGWEDGQPLPPHVAAANPGIYTPRDYLGRVAAVALLPAGHGPYPPPLQAPAAPAVTTAQSDEGLLGGITGFFKGLFGGETQPSAPVPPPPIPGQPQVIDAVSSFVCDPSLHVRLIQEDGTANPPGNIKPGNYQITVWTGQRWQPMGDTVVEAGARYHAFVENGNLKWERR